MHRKKIQKKNSDAVVKKRQVHEVISIVYTKLKSNTVLYSVEFLLVFSVLPSNVSACSLRNSRATFSVILCSLWKDSSSFFLLVRGEEHPGLLRWYCIFFVLLILIFTWTFCSRDITHNQLRHPHIEHAIRLHTQQYNYLLFFFFFLKNNKNKQGRKYNEKNNRL